MPNVRLAIRLRPFTARELQGEFSSKTAVEIDKPSTVCITNIKVPAGGAGDSRTRVRKYAADYCFNSSCEINHPDYATQETVFKSMGQDVLGEVAKGGSCCVLAYGESATGKTYSMMGTETDPGLIPRLCTAIASPDAEESIEVAVSYLEIYNERVGDLLAVDELAPTDGAEQKHNKSYLKKNAHKDLRVREHPTRGPYVQNLSVVKVRGGAALTELVTRAAVRRRTAATRRNLASSRSHALLALSTHHAQLQLADLAGSERSSEGGANAGRLKEGANINRSLVALGNVISALAAGGERQRYIPYRDSALTWLLKDTFAGGRTTFLFATVSPSAGAHAASAHTLRWAARARLLPPAPAPPARPAARFDALLAALARAGIVYIPETGLLSYNNKLVDDVKQEKETTKIVNETTTQYTVHGCKESDLNMENGNNDINKSFETVNSITSSVTSDSSESIARRCSINNTTTQANNDGGDKIVGPQFQRARSDLKVAPPYRNKRRQYSSHEALSLKQSKTKTTINGSAESLPDSRKPLIRCNENTPGNNTPTRRHSKPNIVIQDDKRAEIVASVTQRLYTKLKKTEEMASTKMETIDKKIIEPLSELKICSNARQRLLDISQRALRNRKKIGIPACTQTVSKVVRVKEVGTDVQTDLEPFAIRVQSSYKFYQDASNETCPVTPRCKEASVGRKLGSIHNRDTSTETDDELGINKRLSFKSCSVMTDGMTLTTSASTQTEIERPPRKKKSTFTKYLNLNNDAESEDVDMIPTAIVNINISQAYSQETESSEGSACLIACNNTSSNFNTTPDLLSNHNPSDHDIEVIETPTAILKPVFQADPQNGPGSNIYVETSHETTEQLNQARTNPELCEDMAALENENAIGNVIFTSCNNENDTAVVETDGAEVGGSVTKRAAAQCRCVPVGSLCSEPFALSIPSDNNKQQSMLSVDDGAKMSLRHTDKFQQEDFSDIDDHLSLPRASEATIKNETSKDYKEIIMGNNRNEYPYNLIISPLKVKSTGTRRKTVTFKKHCNIKESANDNDDNFNEHINHNDSDEFKSETMDEINFSDSDSSVHFGKSMVSDLHFGDKKCSLIHHKSYSTNDKTIHMKPIRFNLAQSLLSRSSYNPVYSTRSPIINKKNQLVIPEQNAATYQDSDDNNEVSKRSQPIFPTTSTNVTTESVDKLQMSNFPLLQLERSLLKSCERLEEKVNQHEEFLISLEEKRNDYTLRQKMASPRRSIPTSPSAYLKELLEMRRSIVRESKSNVQHSFYGFV